MEVNIGHRIAQARKAKGFTQQMLADSIGVTQRVITYYERESQRIPATKLAEIALALDVSADELLGLKEIKRPRGAPKKAYLKRKMRAVEQFDPKDQKTITNMIESLEKTYKYRDQRATQSPKTT
ncbi:MAG: helix-turn-helix domain-containing protein [Chitinivibrionales bacterium]|nr:helix-turn-helix domain-containing protein [Chitinivibrionales bacterium]